MSCFSWPAKLTNTMGEYDAQRRANYVEQTLELAGMSTCKPVTTPMAKTRSTEEKKADQELLNENEKHAYMRVVGRLQYYSADRPDLQFPVKELMAAIQEHMLESTYWCDRLQATRWAVAPHLNRWLCVPGSRPSSTSRCIDCIDCIDVV